MNNKLCPFCWDDNVKFIEYVNNENGPRRALMQCRTCERNYWDDTKERVIHLYTFCETLYGQPEQCDEHLKNFNRQEFAKLDRRKMEEFDLLCSSCPRRKFIANRLA